MYKRQDLTTGTVTRISTDSAGSQANGASEVTSISSDGRYVTFHSAATNLVSGDTNGVRDSFIKDVLTGQTRRISTNNSGGDISSGNQLHSVISADGRYATFLDSDNGVAYLRDLGVAGIQQMAGMVVSNRASAVTTFNTAQRYQDDLLEYRSHLGSVSSRINTYMNFLTSTTMNYTAAESRITDADVAQEAAEAVRSKILQQSAASLLSQANQAPALALRLLNQ